MQKSKSDGYDCEENSKETQKLSQSEENHVLFPIFINQFLISLPYFRKKCETLYERCSSKNRFWWITSYAFVVYLEFTGYMYHPHIYFQWICGTFTIKMFIIKLLDVWFIKTQMPIFKCKLSINTIILTVWGVKQSVAEELYGIVAVVAIVKMHLKISLILFEIK